MRRINLTTQLPRRPNVGGGGGNKTKEAGNQTWRWIHPRQGVHDTSEAASNKAQRPAFILLLHCEGFFSPPSCSWRCYKKRGGNRRSNQRGFVILTPYILCSNCCCHQFNYVGLQPATLSCNNTPHAMISTHLPVKPSRRRPQHHLRPHLDSCTNPFTSF